jgi:hypothetical protein
MWETADVAARARSHAGVAVADVVRVEAAWPYGGTVATAHASTIPVESTAARMKLWVGAGTVVLAAALIAAAFAFRPTEKAPAPTTPVTIATGHRSGFPAAPPGAVVFSRQMGGEALALGVVPQRNSALLQASVVGPQGAGVTSLNVSLNGRRASACGPGCYRTTVTRTPRSVELLVRSTHWRVLLPAVWPPHDATALLARARRAWRSLHSLSFSEHLASDRTHVTTSTWRVEAPGSVAYQVKGGWAGVVVGNRRWDRPPTSKRWVPSPQSPLTQPVPPWVRVTDAHVLGRSTVRGRPAWRVSFFDPGTPAWFTVAIDRQTFRTLDSRMTATAHFMHDVYGSFNTTPAIRPPIHP